IQRVIAQVESVLMPVVARTCAGDALNFTKSKYPGLPLDEDKILITVNQEVVPPDHILKSNDTVCFIPGIGGG
ncbi:MAG TPA: MoaD/ThiS family protein, partial [Dehalococcoidales bacterium]